MPWYRTFARGLIALLVLFVASTGGCERGTLIDEEMWRINLILEETRSKDFEKRMQDAYDKTQKLHKKLREVRGQARTWSEEIDSLNTKIAFMEKSRDPLRKKTEKWESDSLDFLEKAVELKNKTSEARSRMVAAQGQLEQVKEEMNSLPQSQKDLLARWNALQEEIAKLEGSIESGRTEIEKLGKVKKGNEEALENLRRAAAGSAAQLTELKKALAMKGNLSGEIEKAKKKIQDLAKEKMDLDGRKGDLTEEVAKREADLKPVKENNELLKQMSKELSADTKRIRSESTRLLMEKGDLESQAKALKDDIDRLEKEIDELKRKKREKERERDGTH